MSSVATQLKARLKPTPMSELSWPRKLRRGFGYLLALSAVSMGVSAATASSDWNITQDSLDDNLK